MSFEKTLVMNNYCNDCRFLKCGIACTHPDNLDYKTTWFSSKHKKYRWYPEEHNKYNNCGLFQKANFWDRIRREF